ASRIGGPHLERVTPHRERSVGLRAGARGKYPTVQFALERAPHLRRREAEAGARAVSDSGRHGRERGIGRRGVDGPGEAGWRRVGVAGSIGGPYLEAVAAGRERSVTLRTRTGRDRKSVV